MKPFAFAEPGNLAEAVALLGEGDSRAIAGGSDLLGELKEGTAHFGRLVSLAHIAELRSVRAVEGGLRIGAGVTLAGLETERRLRGPYGILAEAARGVATPEIRNQGTLGGNLCQRPRCLHFRSPWLDCVKKGGTGCPARDSEHQPYLSVMGGTVCWAVNASDLAPALLALEASACVHGPGGERVLALADFFAGPERDPTRETVLAPDELLSAVLLPAQPKRWQGTYLKARERTAGDFPLVSVAFGCQVSRGRIRDARLVLGGVAPVPWPCPDAAELLEGARPDAELPSHVAAAAFGHAMPLAGNGYKVDLGRALVARAVAQVLAQASA